MLDAEYLAEAERRARRFSGAYTGTSGTLAADVIRLLTERREIMVSLEEANRTIREAIAARHAAAAAKAAAETNTPPLGSVTERQSPARERGEGEPRDVPQADNARAAGGPGHNTSGIAGLRVVAFAGWIGAGKTDSASFGPRDCVRLQWADPIYAALSAILGVPEDVLRDRATKESAVRIEGIEPVDVAVREAMRTLGTEWGRELVHPDLWVALTVQRMRRRNAMDGSTRFAVCGTRFQNEAAAVRSMGGEVWWIDRPGVDPPSPKAHVSERSLTPADCDAIILNDGTLEDLRASVGKAWEDYFIKASLR